MTTTYTLAAPAGLVSTTLHGLSQPYTVDSNGYVTGVAQADVGKLVAQGFTSIPPVGEILLAKLTAANFNSTSDQAIALSTQGLGPAGSKVYVNRIVVDNASVSLTTAAGGFYTAASKGGTAIVASSQTYSIDTSAAIAEELTIAARPTLITPCSIYFSLTTAQGAAATADIYVFGAVLP